MVGAGHKKILPAKKRKVDPCTRVFGYAPVVTNSMSAEPSRLCFPVPTQCRMRNEANPRSRCTAVLNQAYPRRVAVSLLKEIVFGSSASGHMLTID